MCSLALLWGSTWVKDILFSDKYSSEPSSNYADTCALSQPRSVKGSSWRPHVHTILINESGGQGVCGWIAHFRCTQYSLSPRLSPSYISLGQLSSINIHPRCTCVGVCLERGKAGESILWALITNSNNNNNMHTAHIGPDVLSRLRRFPGTPDTFCPRNCCTGLEPKCARHLINSLLLLSN